jgi:hypothetical protein
MPLAHQRLGQALGVTGLLSDDDTRARLQRLNGRDPARRVSAASRWIHNDGYGNCHAAAFIGEERAKRQ